MSGLPEVTDLVVAGSGAAGFAAAITARRAGLDVLLLEKQPELGGTTARSGTWIWIPNNRLMRDSGLVDGRDDALRYMARLVRPDSYVADHPRLGLPRVSPAMEMCRPPRSSRAAWCTRQPSSSLNQPPLK